MREEPDNHSTPLAVSSVKSWLVTNNVLIVIQLRNSQVALTLF